MYRQAPRRLVLMLTMTFSARAHLPERGDIVANIPLDFSIGVHDLRAGDYLPRYDVGRECPPNLRGRRPLRHNACGRGAGGVRCGEVAASIRRTRRALPA